MKPTVFNERVATALKKWHHTAKKETKHKRHSESNTPYSSRPTTPTHGSSPIHLLHNFKNRSAENFPSSPSPRYSDRHDHQFWDPESQHQEAGSSTHHSLPQESSEKQPELASVELPHIRTSKSARDFSFKKWWFLISYIFISYSGEFVIWKKKCVLVHVWDLSHL